MDNYRLVVLIPWFGRWPAWIDLFLESCQHNKEVAWLIYTDAAPPENNPHNVSFRQLSFSAYKEIVSQKLGIHFNPDTAYKLCDIKPALAYIHADEIKDYDFYAFGDIDVIYGQIRQFLTNDILQKYSVISTHDNRISGHFCVFRNTALYRESFKQVKNWQACFENPKHLSFDESHYTKVFIPQRKHPDWLRKIWSLSSKYQRHILFKERYSTILSPINWHDGQPEHPNVWFWKNGRLTNNRNECEYMYLHFMNLKSRNWLPKHLRHQPAAWETLENLVHVPTGKAKTEGFMISPSGFSGLETV